MVLLSVCYNINAINTAGNFFFLHSCEAEHLTQILSPAIYVGAPLNINWETATGNSKDDLDCDDLSYVSLGEQWENTSVIRDPQHTHKSRFGCGETDKPAHSKFRSKCSALLFAFPVFFLH